jgi:hypothetical protein
MGKALMPQFVDSGSCGGILQDGQCSRAVDRVLPSSEGWRAAPGWVPCLRRWTVPTGWCMRTETRHRAVTVRQERQESPGKPLAGESPSTAVGLEGGDLQVHNPAIERVTSNV